MLMPRPHQHRFDGTRLDSSGRCLHRQTRGRRSEKTGAKKTTTIHGEGYGTSFAAAPPGASALTASDAGATPQSALQVFSLAPSQMSPGDFAGHRCL